MNEDSPPLSLTEIENLATATENDIGAADEQLSVEHLIASPLVDFAGDSEIFPEAGSCCSGVNVGDLDNILGYEQSCLPSVFPDYYPHNEAPFFEPLPPLQSQTPLQYPNPNTPVSLDVSMAQLLEYSSTPLPSPLPPLPQQSMMMQPYFGDERFMHIANDLMAGMQYLPYDLGLSPTFQHHALPLFDHAQLHDDFHMRIWQQQNSACSGSSSAPPQLPDISLLEASAFKIGSITPEEKKEKIHRFMRKRNERNFTKKIKYACRKTLADSRPRVRGRFAKNEELGEATGDHTGSHDYEDGDEVKDEIAYDSSDIIAQLTGVSSFKRDDNTEPWTI